MRTPRAKARVTAWRSFWPGIMVLLLETAVRGAGAGDAALRLHVRRQEAGPALADGRSPGRCVEEVWEWEARKTAVVVCDMWDRHWCRGATARVAEMAPRVDAVLKAARARGALIIHCPSDTLKFYEGTAQRELARRAPLSGLRVPATGWCGLDPEREGQLPIDDADGGCDDEPRCVQGSPWRRQIEAIEIGEADAITDSAEALHLMNERGIENVAVLGVHLNMCVLGRPFGIRQLVRQGRRVVLVRDLTDTMYNSRRSPRVSHFTGTDLMVAHVERFWCPTVTSADFVGGRPFRFAADTRARITVMIGEDEYRTGETLPAFAAEELVPRNLSVTVCLDLPSNPGDFMGLERALAESDLVLVSVRRRALLSSQLAAVRAHLDAGRALVGIRTASHAFAPRGQDRDRLANGERGEWADFDALVLGGNYQGHHAVGPVVTVKAAAGTGGHPLLEGVELGQFQSHGSLYQTGPLGAGAIPVLLGRIPGQAEEPVAWTRRYGASQAPVFYTSLGHPDDFANPQFRRLLVNAIHWALAERRPAAERPSR